MKLYITGVLSFLVMVATSVACVQVRGGFNISAPAVFWASQAVFMTCIVIALCYAYCKWDNGYKVSKGKLLRSVIVYCCMYFIAWNATSSYGYALIFVIGIAEIYFARKAFNLIKYKYK
jgi:hypothetical protein